MLSMAGVSGGARRFICFVGESVGSCHRLLLPRRCRWGSCSPRGQLSFSWRLILAPRHVIDYVVAHEVAHLKELNHGPRFWKLTAELTRDVEGARAWLNQHGPALHRYGLQPV